MLALLRELALAPGSACCLKTASLLTNLVLPWYHVLMQGEKCNGFLESGLPRRIQNALYETRSPVRSREWYGFVIKMEIRTVVIRLVIVGAMGRPP